MRERRLNSFFTCFATFTALHRLGTNTPAAWTTIALGLESEHERIRDGTRFALRETYDETLLGVLLDRFHDDAQLPATRRVALELIAALHHQTPPWNGQWWAYHPALQPSPAKTERWPGTDRVLATLRDGLREADPILRRACIDGQRVDTIGE